MCILMPFIGEEGYVHIGTFHRGLGVMCYLCIPMPFKGEEGFVLLMSWFVPINGEEGVSAY